MKPTVNKTIIAIILLQILLSGCKISNRNREAEEASSLKKKSIAWLLAGDGYKAWAIASFSVDGKDLLSGLEACQLDNLDVYHRNLVYESVEGNTRCNKEDPEVRRRGKWSLNADSTAIEVKMGKDLITLQIVELTEKRLYYRSDWNNQVTEAVLVATDYKYPALIEEGNNP